MALKMEWEYKTFRIPKKFDDKLKVAELVKRMRKDGWDLVVENQEVVNLASKEFDLLVFKKPIPKWY